MVQKEFFVDQNRIKNQRFFPNFLFFFICYNVAQKVDIFGKFSKLRLKDQFRLATPALEGPQVHRKFLVFIIFLKIS